MEWNSKEWLESSCQKDLVGLWVPESHSILAFNELKIESKKISFLKNNGEKVQLEHFGISNQKGWKYIKLKPQKSESETKYPPYLKLRPHLVMKQELSHTNETQLGCQIKIFRYKSKADMKRDKYTNWDIYRKVSNP